ncbi:HD-GYP domain-containing protein [Magnetospira sp. QH-2]|uniref:HD-GYP domain-containing protein n=1 Tax=Magnetospira sp. (strain QH-2) TaxID=1288970 RepID=UPI0003E812F2|nr:HD domain-containing phosphohydrolase [Magnetospira sp. QH-2]CCQ75566.1 putative Response regulator with HD domain [Magnetospira sp. QH-2]
MGESSAATASSRLDALPATVAKKIAVCVIESNPRVQMDISDSLLSFYQTFQFTSGGQAIDSMAQRPPAVLLLDELAPPRGGIAVLQSLRSEEALKDLPVVCLLDRHNAGFIEDAKRLGVDTFLRKPFKRSTLLGAISDKVNSGVEASWEKIEPVQKAALQETVGVFNKISDLISEGSEIPYKDVQDSCDPLVKAVHNQCFSDILTNVKGHDNYSYVHSLRVATFLTIFGHAAGFRDDELQTLASGGLVHDIGKMSIPHEVLNKPGRLTDDEWNVMRSHVDITQVILKRSDEIPRGVRIIAEQHHEKLDGTGYPHGIIGKNLNELARMASIVDIFSALTDRRVYKDPMPAEKALLIMKDMTDGLDMPLLSLFTQVLLDAKNRDALQ